VDPVEGNASGIKEFLREALTDINEVDSRLHAARDLFRQRLRAIELAGDPEFQEALRLLEEAADQGEVPAVITQDEIRKRYHP
jgi:hypothetical protein